MTQSSFVPPRALLASIAAWLLLFTAQGGWKTYWTLFGASNQLLAALSLLVVTVWLARTRRPVDLFARRMVGLESAVAARGNLEAGPPGRPRSEPTGALSSRRPFGASAVRGPLCRGLAARARWRRAAL